MEIPNSRSLASCLIATLLLVHTIAYSANARLGVFEAASVSSANVIANGLSGGGALSPGFSISPDGRFVAFVSGGTNLSPEGVGGIFLRDTCRGAPGACTPSTELISVSSAGINADSTFSAAPAVSSDGRYVAFASAASNLVANDTNNRLDYFVRDTCRGGGQFCTPSTIRVSLTNTLTQGADSALLGTGTDISADGRFVAFTTSASLVPEDTTAGTGDVYVRDTCRGATGGCTPTTFLISNSLDGSSTVNEIRGVMPSMSDDGRYITFYSINTNMAQGVTLPQLVPNIYLRDTCLGVTGACTPSTILVSNNEANGGATGANFLPPAISGTGRFVSFTSNAPLASDDTSLFTPDVYLRDTCISAPGACTPSIERVSLTSTGAESSFPLYGATSVSGDGHFVAFESSSLDLVLTDTNLDGNDVFIRDTCRGAVGACSPSTVLASVSTTGRQADKSGPPVLSADGRTVFFASTGVNFLDGTFAQQQIYIAGTGFPPPFVTLAGIVNGASFSTPVSGGVTPGALISVFGTDMSDSTALAGTVPLPTDLGGAIVQINSVSAPLIFSSPTQLNIQIPWELALASNASFTVTGSGGLLTGNTQTLTVVSSNPGIFTTNQAGTGQGAIQIANTASLAAPTGAFPGSRPANRGEFISIFCTALGPVNNVPNSGFITNDAT